MQARTPRQSLAAVVLLAACAALVATSPPPPTAEAETHGEVDVAPDNPARVEALFSVDDPGDNEIVRLYVEPLVETWGDTHISATGQAAIDGGAPRFGIGSPSLELDPTACRRGCTVRVVLDARWIGDEGRGIRTRWSVRLAAEYDFGPPQDAVRLEAVAGEDRGPPRSTWVALGALILLALTPLARWKSKPALRLRLAVAGGLALVGAWAALSSATFLWYQLGGRILFQWEEVTAGLAGVALAGANLVGIARAVRGRDTVLRVVGWLALITIGTTWWLVVEGMGTYRPYEVSAVTLLLGLPAVAAIGGVGASRMGSIGSLVIACQVLMFAATLLVAGATALSFVAGLLGQGRLPDVGTLLIGAIPLLVAVEFGVALRLWRRGRRGALLVANLAVGFVVIVAGGWLLFLPEGGLLSSTTELRVLSVVAIGVVIVGTVGALLLPPPASGEDRGQDRREGDQVGGIAGELNLPHPGDGA